MNKATIWVADWEMQCCGKPFKVGDCVKWEITKCEDDFLPFGSTCKIDYRYEGHDQGEHLYEISGIVTKIQLVHTLYEQDSEDEQMYRPVSYKISNFNGEADGWEKDIDKFLFRAYLVQLDYENDLITIR